MNIVVDTNIWVGALSKYSPYHGIIEAFYDGKFTVLISNEILEEYEEQLGLRYSTFTVEAFLNVMLEANNVKLITPYFHWNLIQNDPDDNKFVDCACSGNALFIVSNDRHFDILKKVDFPKIEIVKLDDFMQRLGIVKK